MANTAFQPSAFQNNAFQITVVTGPSVERFQSPTPDPGGPIVGGTFSKGQWHTLKREIEADRARELEIAAVKAKAEKDKAEKLAAQLKAEVDAKRAAEDVAFRQKMVAATRGSSPTPPSLADALKALIHWRATQGELKRRKQAADDEEKEAIELLLKDE
jgi:hypothetical protein